MLLEGEGGSWSLFQKSDLSENWAFWIPAFAGITDLGAIFHILAREVGGNRLGILGTNHKSDLSENWAFWIPALAGITDLGAIFHFSPEKSGTNPYETGSEGRPYGGGDGEE